MTLLATHFLDRACLHIGGAQAADFLQNLITQDITACKAGALRMAALLTAQGKLLYDFLIFADTNINGRGYVIDCDAAQRDALATKLKHYKLRAAVTITMLDIVPLGLWQQDTAPAPIAGFMADPRHPMLGLRGYSRPAPDNSTPTPLDDWQARRFALGVAQGGADMPPARVFPLEFGFDKIHAINFNKGCFIGQEVASRIYRKGQLRKHLWPLQFARPAPPPQTPIMIGERVVGEIISQHEKQALALLRTDGQAAKMRADGQSFTIGAGVFGQYIDNKDTGKKDTGHKNKNKNKNGVELH